MVRQPILPRLFLLILPLMVGCGLLKRLGSPPEPRIDYRPIPSNLQPNIYLHRKNSNKSNLYISIPKHYLLAGRMKGESEASISLHIDAKIFQNPESEIPTDSISFTVAPSGTELTKPFFYRTLEIPAVDDLHWVRLTLTDRVKGIGQLFYLKMPASKHCAECLPLNAQSKLPLFQGIVKPGEKFELSCPFGSPDSIRVSFKPFVLEQNGKLFKDSTWYEFPNEGRYGGWQSEGIYSISTHGTNERIIIKVFNRNYPTLNTPVQLAEPLKYIAKRDEHAALDTASIRKLAIDEFWLSRAKDANQARSLLSIYYGRVFWANQIFSEHIPGWQTDRGRVLILLGIPEEAISNGKTEKWHYRNQQGKRFTIEFTDTNPFSQTTTFSITKRIPADIEKSAIDGWNNGEPINFGETNSDR